MAGLDIEMLLDALGFLENSIVETIVTTRSPDKSPSAAPMGVTRRGPTILEVKPFRSTTTCLNLLSGGRACMNVTDDPELFFTAAFKHELPPGFRQPTVREGLSLDGADASIMVMAPERHEAAGQRAVFACTAYAVEIRRPYPRVFSRGRAEAVEAVVHATRIEEHLRRGRRSEAEAVLGRFEECRRVVDRVSPPDSAEARVVRALDGMIRGWREGASG